MLRILKRFITEFFGLHGEGTEDLFMKLKKLIVFFLNLYFIANLAAQTKIVDYGCNKTVAKKIFEKIEEIKKESML